MGIQRCHDCGVKEGYSHKLGCDMERCPFCGHQLITCNCCYEKLGLFDKTKYDARTYHLPPDVYKNGLDETLAACWERILNQKGRAPYIVYPIICAKCGALWPDFFRVSDEEWQRYIQIDMRDKVICRACFDDIKRIINAARNGAR